jgi:hypothetical protein
MVLQMHIAARVNAAGALDRGRRMLLPSTSVSAALFISMGCMGCRGSAALSGCMGCMGSTTVRLRSIRAMRSVCCWFTASVGRKSFLLIWNILVILRFRREHISIHWWWMLRIYSGESLISIGTASNLTNNLRFLYIGIVSLTGMNASIIFSISIHWWWMEEQRQ